MRLTTPIFEGRGHKIPNSAVNCICWKKIWTLCYEGKGRERNQPPHWEFSAPVSPLIRSFFFFTQIPFVRRDLQHLFPRSFLSCHSLIPAKFRSLESDSPEILCFKRSATSWWKNVFRRKHTYRTTSVFAVTSWILQTENFSFITCWLWR